MQKSIVLEKKIILSAFLIVWKCRWLLSVLADLEKHQKHAFLIMVIFFCIFKITHFWIFFKIIRATR